MLRVSRRVDYAFRILLELAKEEPGSRVMSEDLANRSGVPQAFLRKIIGDLAKAQLVRTYAGPRGGVVLTKEPEEVNMLTIYEAVEGPILLNTCLLQPGECENQETCPGHDFWGHMQNVLVAEMKKNNLKNSVELGEELEKNPRTNEIQYINP